MPESSTPPSFDTTPPQSQWATIDRFLDLLRCPATGQPLRLEDGWLASPDGAARYPLDETGVPFFAQAATSPASQAQQAHFDRVSHAYAVNLSYPQTRAYGEALDASLRQVVGSAPLGVVAEVCCGLGEAISLFSAQTQRGVGVDISHAMISRCQREHSGGPFFCAQGDALRLPLASHAFDAVFMLGGIHHVPDRRKLFEEVHRILKPGGVFYFREPVSDFFFWRWLRAVVYRLSPQLDHTTERPLTWAETAPLLEKTGFELTHWRTHGLLGFMLFMNSDVLVVNGLLRFIPGIRAITRLSAKLDERLLRLPGLSRMGLQVIGAAKATDFPQGRPLEPIFCLP